MKSIYSAILLLLAGFVYGQTTDELLARQFFDDGEYVKAVELYKKVFRKNQSLHIYENYLNALIGMGDEKGAVQLVKKQIKTHPYNYLYKIDQGVIYQAFSKEDLANKHFANLIQKTGSNDQKIQELGKAFIRKRMSDQAIAVYEHGLKKNGIELYWPQLLSLYRNANKHKDLTDLSMEMLDRDPSLFTRFYNSLNLVLEDSVSAEYLQMRALQMARKKPGNPAYSELLLKIYTVNKNYAAAYRQVVAIDKKNKEGGMRILQFANNCITSKQYSHAIKAYEYVSGLENSYKLQADMGALNGAYLAVSEKFAANASGVADLMQRYENFITLNGINNATAAAVKNLAKLAIFQGQDVAKGVQLLEKLIEQPRLQSSFKGETKLLLGDAYLIQNNIWDAKLMYGQVDKMFKEDDLGQEAKFRNAKLSYYQGEFDWAKGQLDILKKATSQLISNNALDLSLLIQDNTGLDSTEEAMKEYANAEFMLFQGKTALCEEILRLLPFKYPNHQLQDEIYFLQAKLEQKKKNFTAALGFYKQVYENFGEDILADNAIYAAAEIQLYALKKNDLAMALYEKIILEYNSSLYVVDARKKYFALKSGETPPETLDYNIRP